MEIRILKLLVRLRDMMLFEPIAFAVRLVTSNYLKGE